jgi:hypothetical protein
VNHFFQLVQGPLADKLPPRASIAVSGNVRPGIFTDAPQMGRRVVEFYLDNEVYQRDNGPDDGAPPFVFPNSGAHTLDELVEMIVWVHEKHQEDKAAGNLPKPHTEKEYRDGLKDILERRLREKNRRSTYGYGGALERS